MDQSLNRLIVIGNIYPSFQLEPNSFTDRIESFIVENGIFIYCGEVDGLKNYVQPALLDEILTRRLVNQYQEWIDSNTRYLLNKKNRLIIVPKSEMILPGFIDSHCHPISGGNQESKLKLHDCQSWAQARELIIPFIQLFTEDQWIFVYGYSQSWFNDVEQTVDLLDQICNKSPLILMRDDTHSYWINSIALKLCQLDASTEVPAGGVISIDSSGKLNGSVAETAMNLVRSHFPQRSINDHTLSLEQGLSALTRYGIVGFCDAAVKETMLDIYLNRYQTSDIKPWAYLCLCWNQLFLDQTQNQEVKMTLDHLDDLFNKYKQSIAQQLIDPNELYCGSVKLFLDGVVESKTALLSQPYCGCAEHTQGNLLISQKDLAVILRHLSDKGLQAHIHSIGDGATDHLIETLAELNLPNLPLCQVRNYLAHLQFVSPAALSMYNKLHLGANFSPLWFYEDPQMSVLNQFVSPELRDSMYPIRQLIAQKVAIGFGSDWPVSSLNPLDGIERAITRQPLGHRGPPIPIGNLQQTVTLQQALHFYTLGSAYLLHSEQYTGSIKVGKRADFIHLDKDLFAIDPQEISSTKVLHTFIKGRNAYSFNN